MSINKKEWTLLNLKVGALGFAAKSLFYKEFLLENKKEIPNEKFREAITVTQGMPGPWLPNFSAFLGFLVTSRTGVVLGLLALCLPGGLIGATVLEAIDLKKKFWIITIQGFYLSTTVGTWIIIWELIKGYLPSESRINFNKGKSVLNLILSIAVCTLTIADLNYEYILALGVLAGIALKYKYD